MNPEPPAVRTTDMPNLVKRGKVRDLYDLGDDLMVVATDRISAFDVVMNEPIPGKGVVLNGLTRFWLETLPACMPHHFKHVVTRDRLPRGYEGHGDMLHNRAMLVRKSVVLPVECVVRGYIVGGGWKEYQQTGKVSGLELPRGLALAQKLDEPLFTPSTKAEEGHDEPISFDEACKIASRFMLERGATPGAGRALMEEARDRSLMIYQQARDYAAEHGIIIADTKFEFGLWNNQLLLIDEVLTPDSSRFWPAEQYEVGKNPPSFDKQFLRDYLSEQSWDKQPPPPAIPGEIITQTQKRYVEAYRLLTGKMPGA